MPRSPFGNPANDPVPTPEEDAAENNAPDTEPLAELAADGVPVGDPAPPVAADPVPGEQPSESVTSPDVLASSAGERYTLGSWGGVDQYRCNGVAANGRPCRFETLDANEFEEHWQKVHVVPPPKPKPSTLVDANGTNLTF